MSEFAEKLIAWQRDHGRHDLPWQQSRDPYAIWVSEIMLQQTQVSAVIGYYGRFMTRFPDIATLANASQDEVMQYWSGLGYYSRARNLHHAAQTIMREHEGIFPQDIQSVQALKGIGRSTAAAICVFAFGQRHTILDGNVKRVLARLYAIEQWPGLPAAETQLWQYAEALLPENHLPAYIQGLMDFGATLCTRRKPECGRCPMQSLCQAWQQNKVALLPRARPKKVLPEKATTLLVVLDAGQVLLEKRPNHGLWGGLWSLPEITPQQIATEVASAKLGLDTESLETMPVFNHTFTHFKLEITPQPLRVQGRQKITPPGYVWLSLSDALQAAIPTPVKRILQSLEAMPLLG